MMQLRRAEGTESVTGCDAEAPSNHSQIPVKPAPGWDVNEG